MPQYQNIQMQQKMEQKIPPQKAKNNNVSCKEPILIRKHGEDTTNKIFRSEISINEQQ